MARSALASVSELMRREQRYRFLLALADALAILLASALAEPALGLALSAVVFVGAPVLIVVVAKVQGLYDRDDRVVRKTTLAEWRTLVEAAVLVSLVVAVYWLLTRTGHAHGGLWLFLFLTAVTATGMTLGRTAARRIAAALGPEDRCLIIGSANAAAELQPHLSALRRVEVVGRVPMSDDGFSRSDMERIVARYHAHRLVLVPDHESSGSSMVETIRSGKELGIRLTIFPTVFASLGRSTTFDEVNGVPLLGIAPLGLSRSSLALKRTFDVVVATAMLVVLSPLMALIALWIRIDSPGPVLFRQVRIGRDGQPFRMFKFRSMVEGAERTKAELFVHNEAGEGLFKIIRDPRLTKAGRMIRRAHLDELPQLWHVLRGEMSLVGPRPLVEEEDALFCDGDRCRLWLTPGMTGLWQIRGPIDAPLAEMAKLDYLYISNWSLWRDIDILCKTVFRVVGLRGA